MLYNMNIQPLEIAMPTSSLDEDGQERLERVLKAVGGNIDAIRSAVFEVLGDLKSEKNRGRWVYLRNEITRRAKKKIRENERKRILEEKVMLTITPAMRNDACRHEQSLTAKIPNSDR